MKITKHGFTQKQYETFQSSKTKPEEKISLIKKHCSKECSNEFCQDFHLIFDFFYEYLVSIEVGKLKSKTIKAIKEILGTVENVFGYINQTNSAKINSTSLLKILYSTFAGNLSDKYKKTAFHILVRYITIVFEIKRESLDVDFI